MSKIYNWQIGAIRIEGEAIEEAKIKSVKVMAWKAEKSVFSGFCIVLINVDITVEEMRAIISTRIEKGGNDSDPEKREQWRKIPCSGKIPTPDEWLRYAVEKLQEEGREGLLYRYPNL